MTNEQKNILKIGDQMHPLSSALQRTRKTVSHKPQYLLLAGSYHSALGTPLVAALRRIENAHTVGRYWALGGGCTP